MRLVVQLNDVNDNRPQFERVDCVGYVPRRVAIGSEIVTLSVIDFDAGDVVSYRIVGGNDDNCFSLDSSTGVVSLACDLNDIRADSRVLNVSATDGTPSLYRKFIVNSVNFDNFIISKTKKIENAKCCNRSIHAYSNDYYYY
ncbi:fat-like cadherin-related tumor suppressor homolog isoform X1 [Bombyx mori]|uniref:fat-like cadherin-related tumor suppressor homolog isoform X1 n=1 Tax=Bombyx mori TaxID=7091 RepID=UPI002ED1692F